MVSWGALHYNAVNEVRLIPSLAAIRWQDGDRTTCENARIGAPVVVLDCLEDVIHEVIEN